MVKAEWGTKRHCSNCNTKYYDLQKPPVCPKCSGPFDFEALLKSKRRAAPEEAKLAEKQLAPGLEELVLDESLDDSETEDFMDDSEVDLEEIGEAAATGEDEN